MKVSVIVPMYNEEENVKETISRIVKILSKNYHDWELIAVDDGSTDRTLELANQEASRHPGVQIISYHPNRGRGRALRTGFKNAKGDIVVTLDADLTFSENHIPKLVSALLKEKNLDMVIGSPYVKKGGLRNVSPYRALISRLGNRFLKLAFPGRYTYFTGVLRAYRHRFLDSLELESNGKEIHLEIFSKALAIGADIKEIPAFAVGVRKGRSKTRISSTMLSHFSFSLFEKPALLFVILGSILLSIGFAIGIYVISIKDVLNPTRPLMTLMILLILVGIQTLFFGFIATQGVILQRQIYRVQKQNLDLKKRLEGTATISLDKITHPSSSAKEKLTK